MLTRAVRPERHLPRVDAAIGELARLPVQMAVRGLIFTAALACAWFLARGRRWAWWALLLGLGVLGLAWTGPGARATAAT